jgi:hypothetical protein
MQKNITPKRRVKAIFDVAGRAATAFTQIAVLLALLGCSSTPQELEANNAPTVVSFTENYQEIYRRVASTAKRCIAGNMGAYASMAVDTELYTELGYGEIQVSLINMGTRNYYLTARIDRVGTGSKLTVRSGNTLAASRNLSSIIEWANGRDTCPLI